jgi:CDP-glucose 4,6-dehydratase
VATARSGNVVGGGDWAADRLVPDVIRALMSKKQPVIRHPGAIRPWQHVLEPLRGYLILAERLYRLGPAYGGAWNFGPDPRQARPVEWVADRVMAIWGEGAKGWLRDRNTHPHEARTLRLDSRRARSRLGWKPVLGAVEALRMTVEWYRSYARGEDVRKLTAAQIEAFSMAATRG